MHLQSASINAPLQSPLTENVILWLDSMRGWHVSLLIALYFSTVCWLDFVSGDELVLILLYIPVVAFITVKINLRFAIIAALVCSFVWLVDDIVLFATSSLNHAKLLTAAIHFICFTVIATIISRLNEALRREFASARHDSLTGLWNMKTFKSECSHRLQGLAKLNLPFAIVFIDCDNFKQVNDTEGHDIGDQVLKVVSHRARTQLRESDCIARYGGDEFIIFLQAISMSDTVTVIEHLRQILLDAMKDRSWPVTFSIGVAFFDNHEINIDSAIRAADNLMYECKNASKNGIAARTISPAGMLTCST